MLLLLFKFILPISIILSTLKCSNLLSSEELEIIPERLKLSRQTNSPRSQRSIRELTRRLDLLKAVDLGEALDLYEQGNRELLINYVKNQKNEPAKGDEENNFLLINAITYGDLELVKEVLEIPGVDINFIGNSGLLPIELSFYNPKIFDELLSTDINLLANNSFGFNPIKQALRYGRLDLAEKMLNRVEARNEEERKEIEKLEIEFRNNSRKLIKKVKID